MFELGCGAPSPPFAGIVVSVGQRQTDHVFGLFHARVASIQSQINANSFLTIGL